LAVFESMQEQNVSRYNFGAKFWAYIWMQTDADGRLVSTLTTQVKRLTNLNV